MTGVQWLIFAIAAVGAIALSRFIYFKREPAGRGRGLLAALRAASFILILLLIFDPHFNARPTQKRAVTIVDKSLSMQLNDAASRVQADNSTVIDAGSESETRILPALQAAAETGAQRVTLITDGAITDAPDVARWLPSLDLQVDVKDVGGDDVANRAISRVEAPAWAEAGKPLRMRITTDATVTTGNAVVVVKQNNTEVARSTVALPSSSTIEFNASGPPQGGLVRFDVAFESNDNIKDDDVRSIYVFISDKPAGVAIVSFDPDWEPRFLHPVLADALGLPVRTFLRVPAGFYFRGGNGLEAGGKVDEAVVRRAVAEADLVVLHGLGTQAPQWARDVATTARHRMIFPSDNGVDGDWYVSAQVPASPITSLLAGMDVSELPPLNSLQLTSIPDYEFAPLLAGRTRTGGTSPIAIAGVDDGKRWVTALGRGYWRWAFRGGNAKDAYARLWGGLAGWIVQGDAQVAASAIRPVTRTVARGNAVKWIASGVAADSFVVTMNAKRVVAQVNQDTANTPPLAPGHYTYEVRAYNGKDEVASARGPLTVESYSPEFIRRRADMSVFKSTPSALQHFDKRSGTPLHSYSWFYVLLVALLAGEWILRRRWGLR